MLGSAFVFFMKHEIDWRTHSPLAYRCHLAVTIHNLPEGMAVVVEELIPEASQGEHSNLSTIGFALGFVLMMVLDVVLG